MMPIIDVAATAIFTYAAHSFIACAIALVVARVIRRPQERDVVWKAALVAPLATAAIAIGISANGIQSPFVDLAALARHASPTRLPGRQVRIRILERGETSHVDRWFSDPVTSVLSTTAVALAAILVGIAGSRLVMRRRRLARAIADREMIGALTRTTSEAVRLSSCAAIQTPIALSRDEICLPDGVVRDFAESHRRSLVAHEIAHIERCDPAWFFATEIIAAASAFQPLVFVVVRAFRRDVELICDETAVCRTGDRHSLISALALLASPFDPSSPLHGVATAYDGSPLVARAERIANLSPVETPARIARRLVVAIAAGLAILCALPVVSAAPRLTDFPLDPVAAAADPHFKGLVRIDERAAIRTVRRTMTVIR